MGTTQQIRISFLERHCPRPALLDSAIERLGLWNIRHYQPDQAVCQFGERAEACWLIVSGQAEIQRDGKSIGFRGRGEMIGEQAFLTTLIGKEFGVRSADVFARGDLTVMCFDASIQEKLEGEARTLWAYTLASVVNEKLQASTLQRAGFRGALDDQAALLERFAEGEALGVVRKALLDETAPVATREVIIWFSDIANFSTWASRRSPEDVAKLAREIAECQIEVIREAGGFIDKIIGDGLMAAWFIDTAERRRRLPALAIECARAAENKVKALVETQAPDSSLSLRIGMHAGSACFGDFGAKERIAVTLLGPDVNLAARYEQAKAEHLGSIRVSPDLKALVERGPPPTDWLFGPSAVVTVKHGVEIEIFSPQTGTAERTPQ